MAQLVCELVTGQREESYSNASMAWGNEQEPFARAAYEAKANVLVDEVGFILHPTIAGCGASPDGLVGDSGLVEIKCPNTNTALEAWLKWADDKNPVANKYNTQMQMQMACTQRKWCDYVIYDPRMPEKAQVLVVRVDRDDAFIAEMELEITRFIEELNKKVVKLKAAMEAL
jgi:putative phage-type endonuclease